MLIFGTIGSMTTASRMLWAFAREDGVPGSRYISKVCNTCFSELISSYHSTLCADTLQDRTQLRPTIVLYRHNCHPLHAICSHWSWINCCIQCSNGFYSRLILHWLHNLRYSHVVSSLHRAKYALGALPTGYVESPSSHIISGVQYCGYHFLFLATSSCRHSRSFQLVLGFICWDCRHFHSLVGFGRAENIPVTEDGNF